MRRASGATGASVVAAVLLAQLCLAGDCVDGVTPDCTLADAQCGPDLVADASSPSNDAASQSDAADAGDQ